ncbi:hypothetical protein H0H93_010000 [Arthromyces matolae]|nr:hypothetical protein H0H93_010000 [Arthromyces matolae]
MLDHRTTLSHPFAAVPAQAWTTPLASTVHQDTQSTNDRRVASYENKRSSATTGLFYKQGALAPRKSRSPFPMQAMAVRGKSKSTVVSGQREFVLTIMVLPFSPIIPAKEAVFEPINGDYTQRYNPPREVRLYQHKLALLVQSLEEDGLAWRLTIGNTGSDTNCHQAVYDSIEQQMRQRNVTFNVSTYAPNPSLPSARYALFGPGNTPKKAANGYKLVQLTLAQDPKWWTVTNIDSVWDKLGRGVGFGYNDGRSVVVFGMASFLRPLTLILIRQLAPVLGAITIDGHVCHAARIFHRFQEGIDDEEMEDTSIPEHFALCPTSKSTSSDRRIPQEDNALPLPSAPLNFAPDELEDYDLQKAIEQSRLSYINDPGNPQTSSFPSSYSASSSASMAVSVPLFLRSPSLPPAPLIATRRSRDSDDEEAQSRPAARLRLRRSSPQDIISLENSDSEDSFPDGVVHASRRAYINYIEANMGNATGLFIQIEPTAKVEDGAKALIDAVYSLHNPEFASTEYPGVTINQRDLHLSNLTKRLLVNISSGVGNGPKNTLMNMLGKLLFQYPDPAIFKLTDLELYSLNLMDAPNATQIMQIQTFGALVAMYLVHQGFLPLGFNPALLQASLFGPETIDDLTWLQTFSPSTADRLRHWPQDSGALLPTGNNESAVIVSLLASTLDRTVQEINQKTPDQRGTIRLQLILKTLLGLQTSFNPALQFNSHPAIHAFRRGFRLKLKPTLTVANSLGLNSKDTLAALCPRLVASSDDVINMIEWSSSGLEELKPFEDRFKAGLTQYLRGSEKIIVNEPSMQDYIDSQGNSQDPVVRSQIFLRYLTGSDLLPLSDSTTFSKIQLEFVKPSREGKGPENAPPAIKVHTCFGKGTITLTKNMQNLLLLANTSPSDSESRSPRKLRSRTVLYHPTLSEPEDVQARPPAAPGSLIVQLENDYIDYSGSMQSPTHHTSDTPNDASSELSDVPSDLDDTDDTNGNSSEEPKLTAGIEIPPSEACSEETPLSVIVEPTHCSATIEPAVNNTCCETSAWAFVTAYIQARTQSLRCSATPLSSEFSFLTGDVPIEEGSNNYTKASESLCQAATQPLLRSEALPTNVGEPMNLPVVSPCLATLAFGTWQTKNFYAIF